MRETHTAQTSIFQTTTDHEIAYELKRMSDWLDAHPGLLDLIASDLRSGGGSSCGRRGMTLESVLRCAILKQYRQVDYRTLAFYLQDSVSFIEFARLDSRRPPSKSTLQALISAVRAQTWKALHRYLLTDAQAQGVERGDVIRVDATVTESAILSPCDSGLLYDAVRVMVRLLIRAQPVVITVIRDGNAMDQFHDEIRSTGISDSAIEYLGDVWVVQNSQRLSL